MTMRRSARNAALLRTEDRIILHRQRTTAAFLWGLLGCCIPIAGLILVPDMEGYQAPDCQGGGHRRPGVRDRLCTDVRCGGGSGHQRSGACLLSCGAGFGGGFRFSSDATAGRIALSIFGTERPFPSAPGAPGSWRASWRGWQPGGRSIPRREWRLCCWFR